MKAVLVFLALCVAARATPIVFTLSGTTNYVTNNASFAVGDTFTAQVTIDPYAPDANPSDPTVGSYPSNIASFIQFSNGLTFTNVPFEYVVANNYYHTYLLTTYDAIAFYFEQPAFALGFELRFNTGAFADDQAVTPTLGTLVPEGTAELPNPTDWYYRDFSAASLSITGGPINAVSYAPQAVPEPATYTAMIGVVVLAGTLIRRKATVQAARGHHPRQVRP